MPPAAPLVYKMFATYRSYIMHEDNLINQRLQRMLIIQGFLFTAEATLLPKFAESFILLVREPKPVPAELDSLVFQFALYGLFSILIALTGGLAAFIVRTSLRAARAAIKRLQDDWNQYWLIEALLWLSQVS